MDDQERNITGNSDEETRELDREDLEKVTGGADKAADSFFQTGGGTTNIKCPKCKKIRSHTPTRDGQYVCNVCKFKHSRV